MATYTSYLNLKKPEGGERYALADFNANWDKIDAAVGPHNFGTVSSLSALESALDTFGSSLGIRQSRSVWVQFSATSSPFANTGYAGTFYKVFDDRYRVVFYMNANNYVIEGAKTANGWNWGSYAHDSQIDEMDDRLTSKNLSLGSFTTTITNAWENTGLTITVPNINQCHLDIYTDLHIIEIFINDGYHVLSHIVYNTNHTLEMNNCTNFKMYKTK